MLKVLGYQSKRYIVATLATVFLLQQNAEATLEEENIVQHFRKAVRRGKESIPLERHHDNSFHHHPWVHKWKHSDDATPLNSHLDQFTQQLYTRLMKHKKPPEQAKHLSLGDSRPEEAVVKSIEPNFSSGHMIKIEETTTKPKIFITLYAGNAIMPDTPKSTCWFMPIDQALCCPTLGDYRQKVATLKIWDAYTHFSLLAIPPGAKIKYFVGLSSPQSFPSLNFTDKKEVMNFDKNLALTTMKTSLSFLSVNSEAHFFEKLEGGATQIYLCSVENQAPYILDLGSLKFKSLADKGRYARKEKRFIALQDGTQEKKIVWVDDIMTPSHLKDETYDLTPLDILDKLHSNEVLTEAEVAQMKEVIFEKAPPLRSKL